MSTETVKQLVSLLNGKCSTCSKSPLGKHSVHIFKCHKHATCQDCYLTKWKPEDEQACLICETGAKTTKQSREVASTQFDNAVRGVDFRKGVIEVTRNMAPYSTNYIWEAQTKGSVVFPRNSNQNGLVFYNHESGSKSECDLDSVKQTLGGVTLSSTATAIIVHSKFGDERQLVIYDLNDIDSESNPRLLRLFGPMYPERARLVFIYNSQVFGVYCTTDIPRIEVLDRFNFSHARTISISANYQPNGQDTVLVNTDCMIYIASFISDCVLILDSDGGHLTTIGKQGKGCIDLPGFLWGPIGIFEDQHGNVLVGNNDGSLQLYSDGNWSLIKGSEQKGTFLSYMVVTKKYMYLMYGPRGVESDSLAVYETIE